MIVQLAHVLNYHKMRLVFVLFVVAIHCKLSMGDSRGGVNDGKFGSIPT